VQNLSSDLEIVIYLIDYVLVQRVNIRVLVHKYPFIVQLVLFVADLTEY